MPAPDLETLVLWWFAESRDDAAMFPRTQSEKALMERAEQLAKESAS